MVKASSGLPKISVIVPSFGPGAGLRANLESIFGQDYPHLEVILIEEGPTPPARGAAMAPYLDRLRRRTGCWRGVTAAAVNTGVALATGDLVAWLTETDKAWRDSLWQVGQAFAALPDEALYLGNGLWHCEERQRFRPFHKRHVVLNRAALAQGIDHLFEPASFFARSAWDQVGGLNPELRHVHHRDLVLRIAATRRAVLINEFLAVRSERRAEESLATALDRVHENARVCEAHGQRELTSGTLHGALAALRDIADGPDLALIRPQLDAALAGIQAGWQRDVGSSDGFPERGDRQDRVWIPRARAGLHPQPPIPADALPSFSIVVPSFNQASFLEQTLESLQGQDYPKLETWVMDGGSTDGSQDVLRRWEPALAGWVSERDRGPAHAINKGFARAQGDILGWLASDDQLAQGALWEAARMFAADPDLDMVYGNALYIDEHNDLFLANHGSYRTGVYYGAIQPVERIPAYWTYLHAVPQPSVFFRRRLLEKCGNLNERYQFIFDFELFYRFARHAKVQKIERVQAFYRIHSQSKTSQWDCFLVELYRLSRKHWPRRGSAEFRQQLSDFVNTFIRRRTPNSWNWQRRAVAPLIAFSAWTGWGNPEALASWTRRRAEGSAPLRTSAAPEGIEKRSRVAKLERGLLRYRSFFCSATFPLHPGRSGGEIRDFHLLEHLLKCSRVTFYALFDKAERGRIDRLRGEVEAVHAPSSLLASRFAQGNYHVPVEPFFRRLKRWLQQRLPIPVRGPHADAALALTPLVSQIRPKLQADLDQDPPDFLFVSPQQNPAGLPPTRAAASTRLIMASYDVEAVRMKRLAAAQPRGLRRLAAQLEARRARRFEDTNLAAYDGIIAVSELDKQLFTELYGFPEDRILVIANGVDPDYFSFRDPTDDPENTAPAIIFTANFGYAPNHQAALRLIDGIMPRVRQAHPSAATWIVGQGPGGELRARHDGQTTIVTGEVADVRPYLRQATVSCIPLLAGSGTKLKVLEACSAGVPVVGSPIAIEGIDAVREQHLLVGASDEELAANVCRVLADRELRMRLVRSARRLVDDKYAWNVSLAPLESWLAELAARPRRRDEGRLGMAACTIPMPAALKAVA